MKPIEVKLRGKMSNRPMGPHRYGRNELQRIDHVFHKSCIYVSPILDTDLKKFISTDVLGLKLTQYFYHFCTVKNEEITF